MGSKNRKPHGGTIYDSSKHYISLQYTKTSHSIAKGRIQEGSLILTYSHGTSINHFGKRGALNIAEEKLSSPLIPHSGPPLTFGGMG